MYNPTCLHDARKGENDSKETFNEIRDLSTLAVYRPTTCHVVALALTTLHFWWSHPWFNSRTRNIM